MAQDGGWGYAWGDCESAQTQANFQTHLDRLCVQRSLTTGSEETINQGGLDYLQFNKVVIRPYGNPTLRLLKSSSVCE